MKELLKSINKAKIIKVFIYSYLVLPFLIFAIGWLEWYWAILAGVLVAVGFYYAIKDDKSDYSPFEWNKKSIITFLIGIILIAVWCYWSGIGGMTFQNQDFDCRSAIFRALVEYDWPVISYDGTRMLSYYIGFWLPSALVGKLFGVEVGTLFMYIWAVLGLIIVYYLILVWKKKIAIWPLFIFVFFSGLDFVATVLLGKNGGSIFAIDHIEQWAGIIQYSSNTTQLYWVFNQAIPAWIAVMLLFLSHKTNKKNILFILSCIILTSTFPFVGLIPFAIYWLFKGMDISKETLKTIFSKQNIIGTFVIGIISVVYLFDTFVSMNGIIISAKLVLAMCLGIVVVVGVIYLVWKNKESIAKIINDPIYLAALMIVVVAGLFLYRSSHPFVNGTKYSIFEYIMFFVVEFGVYAAIVYNRNKKKIEYYIVIMMLLICPFIQVGVSGDFCMRVSIPSLFVLMILVMEEVEALYREKQKEILILLVIVFLLGAVTPLHEINRSVYNTGECIETGENYLKLEKYVDSELLRGGNFGCNVEQSLFCKYFARKEK